MVSHSDLNHNNSNLQFILIMLIRLNPFAVTAAYDKFKNVLTSKTLLFARCPKQLSGGISCNTQPLPSQFLKARMLLQPLNINIQNGTVLSTNFNRQPKFIFTYTIFLSQRNSTATAGSYLRPNSKGNSTGCHFILRNLKWYWLFINNIDLHCCMVKFHQCLQLAIFWLN